MQRIAAFLVVFLNVAILLTPSMALAQVAVTPSPTTTMRNQRSAQRQQLQTQREQLKTTIEQQREAFRTQLNKLRDEKKKQIIERLDGKLASLNQNATTRMNAAVEKMATISARVQQELINLKAQGVNTASAEAALTQAEAALASASAAVNAQATKTYTFKLTTDINARANVGQTVSLLRQDLRKTHATVVAAKQALMNVVQEMARLKNPGLPPATQSAR